MNAETTSPELARLAELSARIERIDRSAGNAAKIDVLTERRQVLVDKLEEIRLARPGDVQPRAGLVDALAADPTAMPEDSVIQEEIERRAAVKAAQDTWEAKASLTRQAIAQIDQDIDRLKAEGDQEQEERDGLWVEFVRGSHAHLSAIFREQWEKLYAEVVAPLAALELLTDHGRTHLVPLYMAPRFGDDTLIKFRSHIAGRSDVVDQLFPKLASPHRPLGYEGVVDRFRADLARAHRSTAK